MATDYVTSPVTPKGRLYMGIGAGLITLLIRLWGGYPEGVTYAILFMNLVTHLIDRYVVPRYYGYSTMLRPGEVRQEVNPNEGKQVILGYDFIKGFIDEQPSGWQ